MLRLIQTTFFAVLLFSLIGLLFDQNAEATICGSSLYDYYSTSRPNHAILLITVTGIEKEIIVDRNDLFFSSQRTVYHTDFSIDKVLSDNKDFSLKKGSIDIYDKSVEIGKQYITSSNNYGSDNRWIFDEHRSCSSNIASTSYIGYLAFYNDLSIDSCDLDKTYLIKYSNLKKVCVLEDTREILIDRDYGFYVPNLGSRAWEYAIENRSDADYDIYKHGLDCVNNSILKKDHCVPITLSLQFDKKRGDADISFSNLPNLGETAIVTFSDADPIPLEKLEEPVEGRISLDAKMEFVDIKPDFVNIYRKSSVTSEFLYTDKTLSYNAVIRAIGQGNTLITAGYEDRADRSYLHISHNTTEGWPLTYAGNKVTGLLFSDKKQYNYPEPVIISGQFNADVGNYLVFVDAHRGKWDRSELIGINSENQFTFQIDKEVFEKMDYIYDRTDSYYLKLQDRYGGIYEIDFSYSINDEIRNFIYWKYELGYPHFGEHMRELLSERALFTEIEIQRFMELYPELNQPIFENHFYKDYSATSPTPKIIEQQQHSKIEYKELSVEERIAERQYFAESTDEFIEEFMDKFTVDEIRIIVEEKQYSEEKLREILEKKHDLPKIYTERIIEKIFNLK